MAGGTHLHSQHSEESRSQWLWGQSCLHTVSSWPATTTQWDRVSRKKAAGVGRWVGTVLWQLSLQITNEQSQVPLLIPKPTTTQQQLHCSVSGDSMSPVSAATNLYIVFQGYWDMSLRCVLGSVRQEGQQKLHYDVLHSKVKAHEEYIVRLS